MIKLRVPFISLLLLTACSSIGEGWQANQYQDEFTGAKSCRVELGSPLSFNYSPYSFMQFYAENRNGQVRAGIHSLNSVPIAGDIQLKVGSRLYTLTSHDAPLDVTPVLPDISGAARQNMGAAYTETMKTMTQEIQRMGSPYRAYTGKKAIALLRDIPATNDDIKFRTIGINTAASTTASFKAGPGFSAALQKCGIAL